MNDNRDSLATQQAAGLRKLADMIEDNPEVAKFADLDRLYAFHVTNAADQATIARAALKHGAKVDKHISEQLHNVLLSWGAVSAYVLASRGDVCERVVVATREVTEEVPDPEALAAVPTVTVTRTEPVTEWRCKPILAADTETAVA